MVDVTLLVHMRALYGSNKGCHDGRTLWSLLEHRDARKRARAEHRPTAVAITEALDVASKGKRASDDVLSGLLLDQGQGKASKWKRGAHYCFEPRTPLGGALPLLHLRT